MTIGLSGMSPVKINATVLAIQDLQFSPEVQYAGFRHSGNEFASVGVCPGGKPMAKFKTPFLAAYNLIGLKLLLATTFEVYFATFTSGLRNSGSSVNTKLGLNTSCTACVYITGASCGQNGILMADVEVIGLSNNGVANPFVSTGTVALPTLGSEPQLHTMGPYALNASRQDGASTSGFTQNIQLAVPLNDGDSFPRTVAWMGAAPRLQVDHQDALATLTALGLLGTNIATSMAVFFAGIDPTTQLRQATGVSLTITSGRVTPGPIQFALNQPNRIGIVGEALSAVATHPITVATAATLP
jgi:hypothetical protein